MTGGLAVGGSLFPARYIADVLLGDPAVAGNAAAAGPTARRLASWWTTVEERCGPATGVRALFDIAAMPLFAQLGFRARLARFDRAVVRICLHTPAGRPVALLVLPWASRPSVVWREASDAARVYGADWCFVLAPPFLSLVDVRSLGFRRSVDFELPGALDIATLPAFWALTRAAVFDSARGPAPIDVLIAGAAAYQDRVREDLQHGVVAALHALASVIAGRSGRSGQADARFGEGLTLVYRVLFLLFAESRDLVPHEHPIYRGAYAIGALCRDALAPDVAHGLWDGLAAITRLSRAGCRSDDLIVRPFNGRLFARAAAPSLEPPRLRARPSQLTAARDAALQRALVALATRPGRAGREEISYRDLGVEQLGAVYERLLDLDPETIARIGPDAPRTGRTHSVRRKETGTFYTPQPLAEFVVRRTLAPLVSGASSDQILDLRVVDPAMGSGAFLVAACRYLSRAYERALIDEGRCNAADLDRDERADIRRRVAERCLAGVDANPVAVQLARLSLWLTTLARDKPLTFLDHRLRAGNSLIGASPEDLSRPAGRASTRADAPLPLFNDDELDRTVGRIARPLAELLRRREDGIDDVRAKEAVWERLTGERTGDSDMARVRAACSAWCAAWLAESPPSAAELRAAIAGILRDDPTLGAARLARWRAAASAIDAQPGTFHWPIEFADVFHDDTSQRRPYGGFDAVIGNPPWDMLRRGNPLVRFIRSSGLYPSCDRGHVNLYQPFVERALSLTRPGGRIGLIVPWGLAVDDGAASLRARLLRGSATDTIVGLDNASGLFPIHRGLRFMVIVASPGRTTQEVRAKFGVRTAAELEALPDATEPASASAYPVRLTTEAIEAVGGPRLRIPDARQPGDLVFLEQLARRFPTLGSPAGWSVEFGRELNATDDRPSFGPVGLPVLEGKHLQPFRVDSTEPAARIRRIEAARLMPDRRFERPRLAYRDVSGVANRVTLIAAILPANVVTTHTVFCLKTHLALDRQRFLCALLNSYVLNAVVRMLMGGHLTTSLIEGLPVPAWRGTRVERRLAALAARLERRPAAHVAATVQAGVARLYGLDRSEFARVLDRFPLVPEAERRMALAAFDRRKPLLL